MNSNCSKLLGMRNLQEQVKKAFCYQKLFWPFTVGTICYLKFFVNSRPSASNFNFFSWSLEQFFLTVGQNNFGNKILILTIVHDWLAMASTVAIVAVGGHHGRHDRQLVISDVLIHCSDEGWRRRWIGGRNWPPWKKNMIELDIWS